MLTMEGTIEEFLREVFTKQIPLSTRGNFMIQTAENEPEPTPEERAAAWRQFVESHKDIKAVVLDDSRAAIYGEDEDRG
ncbi:MAG: hypothetical protein OHK0029_15440 [Armatimonadaceae bacterium]